jgi:pentatricopeptide repeat protein
MLNRGARPNRHTLASMLKSASSASAVAEALHAHCLRRGRPLRRLLAHQRLSSVRSSDARKVFDETGGSPDLASCNALLDALCLAGDLAAAESLFERMAVRDAVLWTTLVSGLSRAGRHRYKYY